MKKLIIFAFIWLNMGIFAQNASWIYYPGDFEIRLGNKMQNQRTERGAFFPPFWKIDSHYVLVEFSKKLDLKVGEDVDIFVEGQYNIKLDGKLLSGNPKKIHIPAGKHSLNIKVYNQTNVPTIFVDGKTVQSDGSWFVTYEDKEWIDESGKASDTSSGTVYVNAGSWNFNSPDNPPSQFRLAVETRLIASLQPDTNGGVLLDFGRETFGYVVFHGLIGNGVLNLYYGESEEEALDTERGETFDHFTLDNNEAKDFTTPESRAFRYVYVETKGLTYNSVSMLYEYLPLKYKGRFRCSDELLNKIWDVSAYTLHLTTREFFIDGIKRDRWVWSGDAYQSYLMNYYLFFDSPSVTRTLLNLRGKDPITSHINTIMDYTFYWFIGIYDYYRYTGDKSFIELIYPRMQSLMNYCLSRRNANGMMEGLAGDWIFIDWADFAMSKAGEVSFEQLLFYRSLQTMALCAGIVNQEQEEAKYQQLADDLYDKLFAVFWSDEKKAFVHNCEKGTQSKQVTPFTNIFAVIFNCLNEAKTQAVKHSVLLNPQALKITTPYMRFYELEALCMLGEHKYVLQEIRNYWGGMLNLGATSFWEKYNPDETGTEHLAMYGRPYGKSLCHAWGASPLYLFGKYYLGVQPEEEGYKTFSIRPVLGDLQWIDGAVPTPNGEIKVYMDQKQIKVSATEGEGYLYFESATKPKSNAGTVESIGKNKYKIKMHANTEYIIQNGTPPPNNPEMVLRGTCIGVQKPYYLPGHTVYEYPYTPETFPWFYNKTLWIEYLDMLAKNNMNTLYLWNGHPFASLVKLKDYPFAVEVDDETFKKNEEIFAFLTTEAQKRGIWVIQMFYNIIVSKPFAEHYGIKTQERSQPITPLLSDYTRKSIAAFIEKYPNVGLLICLGEAMNTYEDDVEWFIETIIPGVKDGLKALGRTDEPPIVLRAHDTNCQMVMDAALPLYKNLYTMHKYNGESLTTYQPGGPWGKIHQDLSALGSIHISNVHILANLEPFRYGSPDFIQKAVKAMHEIHGANALHLYPQASYWDWPYTADKTEPRLKEMERDWIWYEAWGRYAVNAYRDRNEEITYWSKRFDDVYGCGTEAGRYILDAYEQSGEIAPKLLRKFGITEGNRQTLLLGMFMSQLVNPNKWTVYPGFRESCGPEGEDLTQYMQKEWKVEKHIGETPPQLIEEIVIHGDKAALAIGVAEPFVTKNKEEFARLKNDMYCYRAFAHSFSEKVKAAMSVLNYSHSNDQLDLEFAAGCLENSLVYYKQLVDLTKDTYLYANSMQTGQRRIPIGGDGGRNKTWEELLPYYEKELADFRKNIDFLKKYGNSGDQKQSLLQPAEVVWKDKKQTFFSLKKDAKLFSDENYAIGDVADELKNLKSLLFSLKEQNAKGTTLEFTSKKPVQVLVGYLKTERREFANAPTLETDASANDYGQAEIKIANAFSIPKRGSVNVHAYSLPAGKNTLNLGKGALFVLGVIDAGQTIAPHNAGIGGEDIGSKVDWLFY